MKKFSLVIFDCDGVLVDSEPITHTVLCRMLNELGWTITLQQTLDRFVGRLVRDELPAIERDLGRALPVDFWNMFVTQRNAALEQQVQAVAGIQDVLAELTLPFCVASGADREKTQLSLRRSGLLPWFNGHIFCGAEMARTKPAPDVYLHAAQTMGVDPNRCAVVEDSSTGVTAGVAAGMTVFGYAAVNLAQPLLDAGAATTFVDMRQLPPLLR